MVIYLPVLLPRWKRLGAGKKVGEDFIKERIFVDLPILFSSSPAGFEVINMKSELQLEVKRAVWRAQPFGMLSLLETSSFSKPSRNKNARMEGMCRSKNLFLAKLWR